MKTLLFDLDNTLLGNPMSTFLPAYMPLLGEYMAQFVDLSPLEIISAVFKATRVMTGNTDPALTNADVFWREMAAVTGIDWLALDTLDHMEAFYAGPFHQLKPLTTVRPQARTMLEWATDRELELVIATNPLFPRAAIQARLQWAEIEDYPFRLVTWSENMHAAKPTQAYYREILARIGRTPAEAIMVGDDWRNDIEPTAALGLRTFWIAPADAAPPAAGITQGQGDLGACLQWLKKIYD